MSLVEQSLHDGVAVLTLNDPERRNALTPASVAELVARLDVLEADADVGAVVVTGAGSSFCAGADLGVLSSADPDTFRQLYAGFLRVAACPLPTIAAINGPAVGAGLNLALCCDVRLVSDRARILTGFLRLGLHPGGGHTWMLQRAVGPERAAALVLFSEELRGAGAVEAGLALRSFPDDELHDAAVALAARAARAPRPLVERAKRTLAEAAALDSREAAVELELEAQAWSATQPFFTERLERTRASLGGERK